MDSTLELEAITQTIIKSMIATLRSQGFEVDDTRQFAHPDDVAVHVAKETFFLPIISRAAEMGAIFTLDGPELEHVSGKLGHSAEGVERVYMHIESMVDDGRGLFGVGNIIYSRDGISISFSDYRDAIEFKLRYS